MYKLRIFILKYFFKCLTGQTRYLKNEGEKKWVFEYFEDFLLKIIDFFQCLFRDFMLRYIVFYCI